jgi:hypothetical protein
MVRRPTNTALLALQQSDSATASRASLEAIRARRAALTRNTHHRGEPLEPVEKP